VQPRPRRQRPLDLRWAASPRSERALALERTARLALELADQAARPRRGEVAAPALACDLYRQSIVASLRGLRLVPGSDAELTSALVDDAPEPSELASLLESAPQALLSEAAGGAERAQELSARLAQSSFRSFALGEPAELASLASELKGFASALLRTLESRQWRVERPGVLRWLKVALVAVLLLGVATAVAIGPEKWEASHDLAVGKAWRSSSTYPGACDSPSQDCPTGTNFFVHTTEEDSPWLEFDLGQVQNVSGVRVTNRVDCCLERAQPLVVSVSTDGRKWKEVARNTERFADWKYSFATVQARWVRFEIPKRTNLHLKRVRIFP